MEELIIFGVCCWGLYHLVKLMKSKTALMNAQAQALQSEADRA